MSIAKRMRGWQHAGPFPGLGGHRWDVDASWFISAAMPKAVSGGPAVLNRARTGVWAPGFTLDNLVARIEQLGFPLVFSSKGSKEAPDLRVLAMQKGLVRLRWSPASEVFEMFERGANAEFATTSVAHHDARVTLFDEAIRGVDKDAGTVAALIHDESGYSIQNVGVVGVPLERANYAPGVLDDFDHIVADFKSKAPCGRLVVLFGEPGCGKSFLVRGLIRAVDQDCRCVIVPPHLVQHLGDPALFPALIGARGDERPDLRPLFKTLVEESAAPLRKIEKTFSVDSTGFSTCTYARFFDHKYNGEKKVQRWVKLHATVGDRTNVITAAEVTGGHANDSPYFAQLVERTAANGFDVQAVEADKAYLSHKNLAAVEKVGGTPFIPFKSNSGSTGSEAWERMAARFTANQDDWLSHYHQRSNVEATFSGMKRKFGAAVRSKLEEAQLNEVLLKALCWNLSMLVHAIYEFGVEPKFWMPRDMPFPEMPMSPPTNDADVGTEFPLETMEEAS